MTSLGFPGGSIPLPHPLGGDRSLIVNGNLQRRRAFSHQIQLNHGLERSGSEDVQITRSIDAPPLAGDRGVTPFWPEVAPNRGQDAIDQWPTVDEKIRGQSWYPSCALSGELYSIRFRERFIPDKLPLAVLGDFRGRVGLVQLLE
jgi:hypothetical protein